MPQAWVEFEVRDIDTATDALKARGYRLLVDNRVEPWGQTDDYETSIKSFVDSPADSQVVQGCQFFKIFDEIRKCGIPAGVG